MFIAGSIWQPPSSNPFGTQVSTSGMTPSAALASASTAIVHGVAVKTEDSGAADSLTMKKNMLLKQLLKDENESVDSKVQPPKEKKALSDRYIICILLESLPFKCRNSTKVQSESASL